MRMFLLGLIAIGTANCAGDQSYLKPTKVCVEKTNHRVNYTRGVRHETFDCLRYELQCTLPLELDSAVGVNGYEIICRLPRKPAE